MLFRSSKKEYENCKALARIAVIVELFIITSFLYLGIEKDYILFMGFGMILCAFLLALGKITKQEVKTNEKGGTKEFAGNLGKKKYATKIDGQDAQITLNGVTYTNSKNAFEINGLTITAQQETTEPITLTTTEDTDGIYDMIKNFFTEYIHNFMMCEY